MGNASHQAAAKCFMPPHRERGLQTIIAMQYPEKSIQVWQNRRKNAGTSPASVPLMRPRITGRGSLKLPELFAALAGLATALVPIARSRFRPKEKNGRKR